ncbi:unnamed protein product, partial [Oppiella nova]
CCQPLSKICGRGGSDGRIVGGREVKPGKYPWMVSVGIHVDNKHLACGGALVGRQYVLTAAHCLKWPNRRIKPKELVVRVGAHYRTRNETKARDYKVKCIRVHKNYTGTMHGHDIAVIKLRNKVKFSRRVRPICLPPDNSNDYENRVAMVSGWGHTAQGGENSPVLMEVPVPVWNNSDCYDSYINTTKVTYNMLCAGYREGGKDSCQNDSGGPLMLRSKMNGRWMLIGIVSWGEGCAQPNYPGVYTRVSEYIDWVHNDTTTPPIITTTDNPDDWWDTQPLANICGRGGSHRRIVGGREVTPGSYPWMVSVGIHVDNNQKACGGVLIGRQYVLTAAHCLIWPNRTIKPEELVVRVGAHNRTHNETTARDYKVESVTVHKNYTEPIYGYDIVLIKLRNTVRFSRRVHPICLPPDNNDDYEGREAMVSGWGHTAERGENSPVLMEVPVPVWNNSDCYDSYINITKVTYNMLCAGYREGGKDACQYDSGGPLMLRSRMNGRWVLIGIVSWGEGCARPNYPGVYTRVKPTTITTTSNQDNDTTTPPIITTTDYPNDWWNTQPLAEICGRGGSHRRIVGGQEVTPGSYPWMVGLKRKGNSGAFCGGALIDKQYVLTAAHCFWKYGEWTKNASDIAVRVGAHDLRATEPEARDHEVVDIRIPKDYTSHLHGLDIAVLKLKSRVKFSRRVHPICLPPDNSADDYTGRVAMVSGWGLTKYRGNDSPVLQELSVHVLGNQKCGAIWDNNNYKILSGMICTGGYSTGGKGVCRGDSGGPVMLKSNSTNRWVQIGVVSWGPEDCALAQFPDVNTRVSEYIKWIRGNK